MKKSICLILLIVFILSVTSCIIPPEFYIGEAEYFPYYQIAILNQSGGESLDGDIEILEKDNYGRILFTSTGGLIDGYTSFTYGICQIKDEENIYFYDAICVISDESKEKISAERLEEFKAENDWNREISIEKCSVIKISKYIDKYTENIPLMDYMLTEEALTRATKMQDFTIQFGERSNSSKQIVFINEYRVPENKDFASAIYLDYYIGLIDVETYELYCLYKVDNRYDVSKELRTIRSSEHWTK